MYGERFWEKQGYPNTPNIAKRRELLGFISLTPWQWWESDIFTLNQECISCLGPSLQVYTWTISNHQGWHWDFQYSKLHDPELQIHPLSLLILCIYSPTDKHLGWNVSILGGGNVLFGGKRCAFYKEWQGTAFEFFVMFLFEQGVPKRGGPPFGKNPI